MSCESNEITYKLAELGAVEALANLGKIEIIQEYSMQALWALSNIAGESIELRNKVYSTGIGESVIRKFYNTKTIETKHLGIIIFLLSNLLKFKPVPNTNLIKEFISMLPKLLTFSDEEILFDTLRSIEKITSEGENIELILNTGLTGRIISLLDNESIKVKTLAINVISNLSNGDDIQIQVLIDLNVVDYLYKTLESDKRNLKKSSLFVLSNIASGP